MPRTTYSDVNVFYRAVRVLPVIAIAALIGGLIGGFSIYAIDAALNWDARGGQPDIRAAATEPQSTQPQTTQQQQGQSPVRAVGGAIPDPSAGMSGPPPALQPAVTPAATQQAAAPPQPPAPAQNSTQLSPQLLTPQPLGPPSQFQHTTTAPAQTQPQPQPQPQLQAQPQPHQPQPAAQPASATAQQPNMQQTPQANAPTPRSANSDNGADRKTDNDARTAATSGEGEGGAGTTRHARHARQRRRYDARAYDRYYDSYGRPSYGTPSYGTPRGVVRQPQDADRMPRPVPFWGGGFFRGDRFGGYSGD